MKRSTSKPAPSPARPDNYPPPLMKFLRDNTSNRSRRKSRSSRATSLFSRRKRHASSSAIEAQQEPSSPKVTCIGQVRVRRASEPKPALTRATSRRKRDWSGKPPPLCHSLRVNWPPRLSFRPCWRKLTSFFRCGKVRVRTDSGPVHDTGAKLVKTCRVNGADEPPTPPAPPTPPKNALFLTRCRSDPHTTVRFLAPGENRKKELEEATEEVDCSEKLVVVLRRSKSGPASVWRERRFEFTLLASSSSSTHSVE